MVEGRNRAAIDESTEGQPREGMGDTKTPLHRRRWWLTGKVSSQGKESGSNPDPVPQPCLKANNQPIIFECC
jgi:hypothetical protein